MPLRRRPSEPSARVRALLESAEARAASREDLQAGCGGDPTERAVASVGVGDVSVGRTAGIGGRAATHVEPWLPERSWIEVRPLEAAPPRPATGVRPPQPGRHRRPRPPGPRLLTLPASLRGARLSGPQAAAAGLLLVVVVAAVGFGVRVAWAKAASTPHVVAPSQPGSALATRGASGTAFASSATASGGGGPPGSVVTVHVVGQVRHPGVLTMPAGSRVSDAVVRAGVLKGADLAAINLACPLVDGEQIRVPKPGEVVAGGAGPPAAAGGGSGSGPGATGQGGAGVSGGLVNLNTATAAQLEELPGVGPVLAQRIVDWRTEHGRFANVDELGEVSGIGEKIFAALQPKVTV